MPPLTYIAIGWLICACLGGLIGSAKKAGAIGFVLGLLLGPIGLIAAFAIDRRRQCPECGGRLAGDFPKCQNCGSPLPVIEKPEADRGGLIVVLIVGALCAFMAAEYILRG